MRLEGAGVGGAERIGELFRGLGVVLAQSNAGELETTVENITLVLYRRYASGWVCVPNEPQQTLGGDVLLGLELVAGEILDVFGVGGGSELTVADFLFPC